MNPPLPSPPTGSPAPVAADQTTQVSWLRKHQLALLASVVTAGGFAWLLRAGALPIIPGPESWQRVHWWTVPVYGAMWTFIQMFRCARWYWLLAPIHKVSLGRSIRVGLIGYGAQVLLPFRLGEAVRPALIRKAEGVPLGAATGTVGAERLIDGVFLSSVLLVALLCSHPLSPLPDHIGDLPVPAAVVPTAAWTGTVVFGALSVGMVIFYLARDWARNLTLWLLTPLSAKLAVRVADTAASLASGLRFLAVPRTGIPFLVHTAAYWLINISAVWFLLWGSGVEAPSLVQSAVVLGVMCLGVVVPNAPGYFGSFQISGYAGLVMFFPLAEVQTAGAAFVFLLYALQISVTLVVAGIALLVEKTSLGEVLEERAS